MLWEQEEGTKLSQDKRTRLRGLPEGLTFSWVLLNSWGFSEYREQPVQRQGGLKEHRFFKN